MTEAPTVLGKRPAAEHKPMPGYALVFPLSAPDALPGALWIPAERRAGDGLGGHFYARVVAVGPPAMTRFGFLLKPDVKPGDHVLCARGFGTDVELAEGRHVVQRIAEGERHVGIVATWEPGAADLASKPLDAPEAPRDEDEGGPENDPEVEAVHEQFERLKARGRAGGGEPLA